MFKTNEIIRRWHIAGFFWIVIVGSLLHFTYEWSGKSTLVGYFSPVNESLWEHLKLGYFSLSFFILIEYWVLRNKTELYFLAKAVGIIAMSILIVLLAYMYDVIARNSNMYFHIGLFIASAFLCQLISMNIMKLNLHSRFNLYGLIAYIVMGLLLIVLTPFQIRGT
ncbi:MAG: hypothetical protein GX069_08285 [Tissierellia bacterium]|nr:hypothetical protein [Tissierellia bacterium]